MFRYSLIVGAVRESITEAHNVEKNGTGGWQGM